MPELVLYHFPGACSQVCIFALEQTGLKYELRLVDLASNEQSSAEYHSISSLAKVPAMTVDGVLLTENAAIQTYIAEMRPEGGLFPADRSPWALANRQAGFSFCGGTLHPIVRGLRNPARLTVGDVEPVRQQSIKLATKAFGYAEERLADSGWWLGSFSVIDVYLNWAISVARLGDFNFAPYPSLDGLKDRLMERPAFALMMEKEDQARAVLEQRRKAA